MTNVDALLAFLRARYAERRALAEAASPAPWTFDVDEAEILAADGITVCEAFALSGNQLRATARHIAENDPNDVLDDLDAKLGILEHYERVCDYGKTRHHEDYALATGALEAVLMRLAVPYKTHPDYRAGWRPDGARTFAVEADATYLITGTVK